MYKFILLLLIVVNLKVHSQEVNVNDIRDRIEKASFDKDIAFQLVEDLAAIDNKSPLLTAYHATAEGILCMYLKNPAKLLKHASNSSQLINTAVKQDSNNLEVRFIRFTIENNIPKVLGFSKHQNEDKAFLIGHFKKENFGTIPYNALEKMIHTLEETEKFSKSELLVMKAELND